MTAGCSESAGMVFGSVILLDMIDQGFGRCSAVGMNYLKSEKQMKEKVYLEKQVLLTLGVRPHFIYPGERRFLSRTFRLEPYPPPYHPRRRSPYGLQLMDGVAQQ